MSNHSGFEKEMIYDNGNSNGTNLVRANEKLRKLTRTEIKMRKGVQWKCILKLNTLLQ